MFSFWVNDTTIFPVTQAWHLHTMPALIIVKYGFDYFTPFKNIPWQFLSLESTLAQAAFLTLSFPSSSVRHMLLSEHDCCGPSGPHAVFQAPLAGCVYLQVHLSWLLLKENSHEIAIVSLCSLSPFSDSWYWIMHFHFQKSFHPMFKNFTR